MSISDENKERLAKFGDARDSLDDCLGRVLDLAEAKRDGLDPAEDYCEEIEFVRG